MQTTASWSWLQGGVGKRGKGRDLAIERRREEEGAWKEKTLLRRRMFLQYHYKLPFNNETLIQGNLS
jgi:hypothetical protein